MFWRVIWGGIVRQKGKMVLISITVALGASLAAAMLLVFFDIGDKVNQELKTYGANITVIPKGASLLSDLYGIDEGEGVSDKTLREDELGKLKTIFWAFNIVDFAPFLETGNRDFRVLGTWFNKEIELPTGEKFTTGISNMKSWWDISGVWADDENDEAMMGSAAAAKLGIGPDDRISAGGRTFTVAGVFNSGSDEDDVLYIPLTAAQEISGRENQVHRVEVSALTTPDNELSRRAARDPSGLSVKEWETWYCTAYVSAICYQIDEVITNSVSKPIRQVAESEGAIMEKISLLMLFITVISLAGSALGISNLVTAAVIEKAAEIGLIKALGATDGRVSLLVLTQIIIAGVLGGAAGFFLGLGFAQIIGQTVFASSIALKPLVLPITAALVCAVTLAGSIPAVRLLLSLRPAEVLHGR